MKKISIFLILAAGILFIIIPGCDKDDAHEDAVYTLALSANPSQYGDVQGAGEYEAGEIVTLTATPGQGYDLLYWTNEAGDTLSWEADFEYTMPAENITLFAIFILADGTKGTVTDYGGNVYQTVYIGGVEWLAENLRTTKYANGDEIPGGLSDTEWANTTMGAYGIYTYGDVEGIDSDEQMVDAYGKLYNWYAVDDGRGLCPSGWHVPSEEEWTAMENYLIYSHGYTNEFDDPEAIGNVLKAARQVGHEWGGEHDTEEHPRWKYAISETSTGMDVFGFSLFPAGRRHYNGGFFDLGSQAQLWLSTENTPEFSEVRTVLTSLGFISKSGYLKGNGYSVRCIKSSN